MFKYISALTGAALLSACASQPEDIQAAYVSPNIYANYTCPELFTERERVVARVNLVADAQSDKATNDAVATGVGIILFWPALFLLASGSDREAELAQLKGNYDAIEQAITARKCALDSPSAAPQVTADAAPAPKVDDSFEAQQRSINGEADAPAPKASEPVVVAAVPAQSVPATTPAPAAPQPTSQPTPQPVQRAPDPQPVQQPVVAAPQPTPAPEPPAKPVVVASKPTPVAAAAASPSIPASLYDDPNLAKKVDYSLAEIREYCGQAWRIRDLTDGTFEINPCYDRRYN